MKNGKMLRKERNKLKMFKKISIFQSYMGLLYSLSFVNRIIFNINETTAFIGNSLLNDFNSKGKGKLYIFCIRNRYNWEN